MKTDLEKTTEFCQSFTALILLFIFAFVFFLFILPAIKLGELYDWTLKIQRPRY